MPNSKKKPSRLRDTLKKYRVELIAFCLALLGVFLLVEPFEIRQTLRTWLGSLDEFFFAVADRLIAFVRGFTPSDLLGLALLALTLTFIAWRARYRFLRSNLFMTDTCPRCGQPLHRKKRTRLDLFFGFVTQIELRRYQCVNRACRWQGLRRYQTDHSSHHRSEDSAEADVPSARSS